MTIDNIKLIFVDRSEHSQTTEGWLVAGIQVRTVEYSAKGFVC